MNKTMTRARLLGSMLLAGSVLATSAAFSQNHAPAPAPAHAAPPAAPAAAPTGQPAHGVQRFEVRPTGMSRVTFTSDAPLETIDGVSTTVSGNVTVNLDAPNQGLAGRVVTETATLRTGSDMRDEHLRSANWLDAQHFPQIAFEVTSATLTAPLAPNAPATGRVRGRITIHGVTHEIEAPVQVRYVPLSAEHAQMAAFGVNSDMLRIESDFTVRLTDYNVSIMLPLRLKVSNEIRVRVNLTAFRL